MAQEGKRDMQHHLSNTETQKTTKTGPKGIGLAAHLHDGKMYLWLYMDRSLVFILDTCWGGHKEPFICVNKQTGERQLIVQCPKALNVFNDTMFVVDCWNLIQAPKHGITQSRCMVVLGNGQ